MSRAVVKLSTATTMFEVNSKKLRELLVNDGVAGFKEREKREHKMYEPLVRPVYL